MSNSSSANRYRIVVCRGPECGDKRDSAVLYQELERLVQENQLGGRVVLEWQSCFGQCRSGPNILVRVVREAKDDPLRLAVLLPTASGESVLYQGVRVEELEQIIQLHIVGGRPIRAMMRRKSEGTSR
jgi:(2Fe-2S) ferredoxin